MVFASRTLNDWRLWRAFALILAFGLFAVGCGKGRSSEDPGGPGPFPVPELDLHGDEFLKATRIIPDGSNFSGAINFPTDVDWFTYPAVVGVTYCLQIAGYAAPIDPNFGTQFDLTGEGDRAIVAQIVGPDGATQILNTTGTGGGTAYNINPAHLVDFGGFRLGDTRIMWVSPTTDDYFIRLSHERSLTGIGIYELNLSSSQQGTISGAVFDLPPNFFTSGPFTPGVFQTGSREFRINQGTAVFDDMGMLLFEGVLGGAAGVTFFEFPELDIGFIFDFPALVTFPMDMDPQTPALHIHSGFPNNFVPQNSFYTDPADGDNPHPTLLEFDVTVIGGRSSLDEPVTVQSEAILNLSEGRQLRIPTTISTEPVVDDAGNRRLTAEITLHLGDGLKHSRGGVDLGADLGAELLRTILGFRWFMDVHFTDDLELVPRPVATSRPEWDSYSFFEAALNVLESNIIRQDGTRLVDPQVAATRGFDPGFTLFYDSALKTFQVARQVFFAGDVSFGFNPFEFEPGFDLPAAILPADSEPFVRDRILVHAGGVGQVGPVLIDLGVMPAPSPPPTTFPGFPGSTRIELVGFRNVIKQLTDAEAELLRDAFYGNGFYVEVTDDVTGQQLARAEGFLEISLFDAARTSASNEPFMKGAINFACEYAAGGGVTVISNGKIIGVLDEFIAIGGDPPGCGLTPSAGAVGAAYWPGEYYYRAFADDGTEWEGHFEIGSDTCETIVLSMD